MGWSCYHQGNILQEAHIFIDPNQTFRKHLTGACRYRFGCVRRLVVCRLYIWQSQPTKQLLWEKVTKMTLLATTPTRRLLWELGGLVANGATSDGLAPQIYPFNQEAPLQCFVYD